MENITLTDMFKLTLALTLLMAPCVVIDSLTPKPKLTTVKVVRVEMTEAGGLGAEPRFTALIETDVERTASVDGDFYTRYKDGGYVCAAARDNDDGSTAYIGQWKPGKCQEVQP